MEKMSRQEEAKLKELTAKKKRIDRERKAFFGDVVKNAEQIVDYLLEKKPEAVLSALQKYGYGLVRNGEESGHDETNSDKTGGQNSDESIQTSVDDFGFDDGDSFYDEPQHF